MEATLYNAEIYVITYTRKLCSIFFTDNYKINAMKKLQRNERILYMGAGILLLSILLMIIIIPGILNDTKPSSNPIGAVTGVSYAIIIHLLIFIGYITIVIAKMRDGKKRKAGCIVIGILLILFGLIYMDGAFAFFNHKNILYVSFLMFASVLFDLIASILIFTSIFLKSKKIE